MDAKKIKPYIALVRLNKPIGILLLLWPTLWALWLASAGHPDPMILFVFVTGVIVMRSAGCIANDIADRHFDAHVTRTRERPLASGKISVTSALVLFFILLSVAFGLVLLCNALTIQLAFIGAGLAIIYPFLKRITHLPQLGLGLAFTWGVPMAFAAETNAIGKEAWFLFLTAMLWPIIYDTMYAMVDRDDDIRIGVKSTAILFGAWDKNIIAALQLIFLSFVLAVGVLFELKSVFYICVFASFLLFIYQQWLIKNNDRDACFRAFLNNNWVGLIIFLGIFLSYLT
jgi:4-hydroxybenzoate polyprenyltransferase